jgi:3-phenylpropionate/trans-cinnamate dioxygenase ferredoxin subunit
LIRSALSVPTKLFIAALSKELPAPIELTKVDGEFFAFADACTHDDGPVAEGELDDYVIECPRHGAKFDIRTGKVKQLPAVTPIPVCAVQVEGDTVLVSKKSISLM